MPIFILFIFFVEKSFSQDTPSYLVVDNCNQYKSCESCVANFIEFNNSIKNGFDGIDGIFRFLPNGAIQRNLAVLQIGNGRFETIESSTPKFMKY